MTPTHLTPLHLVSVQQDSVQRVGGTVQRCRSSVAVITTANTTSSKLKQLQRKYTPNKDRSGIKKPTGGNQGAKRIQLDLTSQEQKNSKSRNQSQCGSVTQRCNSKIGMGLRNLGMTQAKIEMPTVTRVRQEAVEEQPRAPTSNQVQPVRSEQQLPRRADEHSPLPFGKSPRPEQASPRLDNLRFQKAD